ncbi:hypothetical protein CF319_g8392 [Tilletia indica]|nr:hypothetical protein CF319_g8392 [Tilletia indica]
MKGHACSFPLNTVSTATKLPWGIGDGNGLVSCLVIGPRAPRIQDLQNVFKVRRKKVSDLLDFLRKNFLDFPQWPTDEVTLNQLPEDDVPELLMRSVLYQEHGKVFSLFEEETTGLELHPALSIEADIDSPRTFLEHHGMLDVNGTTVPGHARLAAALANATGIDRPDLIIRHGATFVQDYKNPALFPGMFPTLFPWGVGNRRLRVGSHSHTLLEEASIPSSRSGRLSIPATLVIDIRGRTSCRFIYPHDLNPRSHYDLDTNSINLRIRDPLINWHNPSLLVATRHNHDLKSVQSGRSGVAAASYITSYATKSEETPANQISMIKTVLERMAPLGQDATELLPAAVSIVDGPSTPTDDADPSVDDLYEQDTGHLPLSVHGKAHQVDDYLHRGPTLSHLSFYDFVRFCKIWKAPAKANKGYHPLKESHPNVGVYCHRYDPGKPLGVPRAIFSSNPRSNGTTTHGDTYCAAMLAQFIPFDIDAPLKTTDTTYEDAFQNASFSADALRIMDN